MNTFSPHGASCLLIRAVDFAKVRQRNETIRDVDTERVDHVRVDLGQLVFQTFNVVLIRRRGRVEHVLDKPAVIAAIVNVDIGTQEILIDVVRLTQALP